MAIRRVTRWFTRTGLAGLEMGYDASAVGERMNHHNVPVTLTWDDGKEEPQVKTRERRVECFVMRSVDGGICRDSEDGMPFLYRGKEETDEYLPAVLIVTEPVPEPSLVEAVEALDKYWRDHNYQLSTEAASVRSALQREKQKSTR
jgi:hypothetical protein